MNAIPNREPDFVFPHKWIVELPALWAWVQANALHLQQADYAYVWQVWMPIQDEQAT